MFSGIIEDTGTLVAIGPRGNGRSLEIQTSLPFSREKGAEAGGAPGERMKLGDSIAVMGACLTVESFSPEGERGGRFTVAAGAETLARTTLGGWRVGDRLHLERALRLGDRLDGHLVSGHVDGIGRLRSVVTARESIVAWVELPAGLARYVAEKGSICIDGISLTVNELGADGQSFRVNLIPFTATRTAVGSWRDGQAVNLEVDLLARYLERLVQPGSHGPGGPEEARLSLERMQALGFGPPPRSGSRNGAR